MKKRIGIIIVVLLLIASGVWWRQSILGERETRSQPRQAYGEPNAEGSKKVTDEDIRRSAIKGSENEIALQIRQIREIVREANKPIEFYGIVVDQNEKPLSGAKVSMQLLRAVEVLPGLAESQGKMIEVTTGADGLFKV